MNRHPVLSHAQREVLETAHFFLDDREIARYGTFSDQDLARMERGRRREFPSIRLCRATGSAALSGLASDAQRQVAPPSAAVRGGAATDSDRTPRGVRSPRADTNRAPPRHYGSLRLP